MKTLGVSWEQAVHWKDYLELTKPKVLALLMLTAVIGMFLATPGMVPMHILLLGNLGIACCAGSAAVVNHVVDRQIDRKMARTEQRPVATGSVSPTNALFFALVLGATGFYLLMVHVNPLTAWLTGASLIGYAVVYTLMLKRATPQNIVIGGLAGAAPPLLGWTAVTGTLDAHALLLVLIIFAWTPPHFWALAIHRQGDYAKAGVPMLPVTHGEAYTKLHIVLYTIILCIVTLLPYLTGMSGKIYLLAALMLNARFLQWTWRLLRHAESQTAMQTFRFSITYLMLLFAALLVDHYAFYLWV